MLLGDFICLMSWGARPYGSARHLVNWRHQARALFSPLFGMRQLLTPFSAASLAEGPLARSATACLSQGVVAVSFPSATLLFLHATWRTTHDLPFSGPPLFGAFGYVRWATSLNFRQPARCRSPRPWSWRAVRPDPPAATLRRRNSRSAKT